LTQIRQPISLETAQEATVTPPKPDKMALNEANFFSHQENMQNAQLGWVGRMWGARSEKPGNVSAIIALLLSAYLGILIFVFNDAALFNDIFAGLTSIITLILGYLFGSSDREK
jgi:hypothetical protein